ncbi:MAG: hypothetical protein JRC90_09835 [Deltaproteobacteria bacterium]|nr:hypothetical protein [Deltaproteobacteria bacterium]
MSPLLIKKEILTFPLKVEYSDKPDFRIYSKSQTIGIEVTESSSPNFGHALALSENSDGIMDLGDFRFSESEEKKKRSEIERLLNKDKLTNPPWEGNSAEKEWVGRAKGVTLGKVKKFDGYPNHQNYHPKILLVFDVHSEPVDFKQMTDDLMSALFGCEEITRVFRYIVFIDNAIIFMDTVGRNWWHYNRAQLSAGFQE